MEKLIVQNRKAFFEYEILERFEVGLVLKGTEVKSLRQGRASFRDSYAGIKDGEIWLYNLNISVYDHGNVWNHDPGRTRKLLMHKKEIKRLRGKTEEKGLTLVPLKLYFKDGIAKLELGLARGKKIYDKRRDIAKRDADIDARREMKQRFRINM